MSLVIGLDVGTQGVKGLVLDPDRGVVIAREARALELLPELPPGAAEQPPQEWWDACVAVVRDLLATDGVDPRRIVALGVSGQQHGSVFLDAEDRPVRPAKLWCDTATVAEARTISDRLGRAIPVGFTASKIAWLAAHEPDAWARTTGVLLPHDFVNLRLTGRRTTEAGDASGTGYFDPSARDWDEAALAAVAPGLDEKLPHLLATGEPVGRLSPEAAETLGLPREVLVAPGGGDNMMSAIGSGATRRGVVVVSLGTSGTVFSRTEHPVLDPEGLIAPFCSSDGGWLPLLCVMNCTNVTEEVRHSYRPDDADALERLTAAAARVPAGCEGVTFVPFLQGERVPDLPDATGRLLGLRPGSLRAEIVFRAALEGVTCNLALGVERLRSLGVSIDEVRLVGGGSRNPLWRTLVADLLEARVVLPVEAESAALGGALQALWCFEREAGAAGEIDAVTAPFVSLLPDAIDPDPARQSALGPVLERFRRFSAEVS